MSTKRAGDIMIPLERYPHVPEWYTLKQAITILKSVKLEVQGKFSLPRAILVFSDSYELVGIVRRRDILRGLEPSFLSGVEVEDRRKLFDIDVDPELSELTGDRVLEALKARAERLVSEVMLPITMTVDYRDNLLRIIYEMVQHDISMLPVMKDQKVVGVVRSVELLEEVAAIVT